MSRETFEAELAASLCWTGVEAPPGEPLATALHWIWLVWAAGHDQVPPFWIHDLGMVLCHGRTVRYASPRRPEEERPRRLRQEDRLLSHWLSDGQVYRVHVAVAGLDPPFRDQAVAHAITLAAPRMLGALALALESGDVAAMRTAPDWVAVTREELLAKAGEARLAAHGAVLDAVVAHASGQPLFRDEDVWEVAHLQEIPTETARIALRTLHRTIRQIGPARPETIARLRQRAREVPTDETAADVYPTGGFDAMSTRGTLENLVRSEVGYVGEVVAPPLDLFDLRYLEGELLYYTRDESPLLESRRRAVFVLDIDELDNKVRDLPTQTWVLALALIEATHLDLLDAVGPLAAELSLTVTGSDRPLVEQAACLMRASLATEIAHRRVRVDVGDAFTFADPRTTVLSRRPRVPTVKARMWLQVGGRHWHADLAPTLASTARLAPTERTWSVDPAESEALRALVDVWLLQTVT